MFFSHRAVVGLLWGFHWFHSLFLLVYGGL